MLGSCRCPNMVNWSSFLRIGSWKISNTFTQFILLFLTSIPLKTSTRKSGPQVKDFSSFRNDSRRTLWLNSFRSFSMLVYFYAFIISLLWYASYSDWYTEYDYGISEFVRWNTFWKSISERLVGSSEGNSICLMMLRSRAHITKMMDAVNAFIVAIIKWLWQLQRSALIINNHPTSRMSYLNVDTLEKSILGKSVLVNDPIRIQAVANLQNIPGLKMKTTTEEWANSDNCSICKQPFNPQRNVNRHHCRICGGSVCGQCSKKRINSQRSCDFCFLKQHLKKQEHERKEQFRLREQSIQKMNNEIKEFQVEIENLDKEIQMVDKTNLQMEINYAKEIVEKQAEIKKKQEEFKKKQEALEIRKKDLNEKKEELESREERNKIYFSKVQIIKLDISSKQTCLLERIEELQRLKNDLQKLEIQRRELMDELK